MTVASPYAGTSAAWWRLSRVAGRVAAFGALLTWGAIGAPRTLRAQVLDRSVRLPVAAVADSTFTFEARNLRWVKPGERGMAVDPRRHDALVARFEVVRVDRGLVTALITGETTRLTPEHVVVLEVPVSPWYRSSLFWTGAVLGMLAGAFAGSH